MPMAKPPSSESMNPAMATPATVQSRPDAPVTSSSMPPQTPSSPRNKPKWSNPATLAAITTSLPPKRKNRLNPFPNLLQNQNPTPRPTNPRKSPKKSPPSNPSWNASHVVQGFSPASSLLFLHFSFLRNSSLFFRPETHFSLDFRVHPMLPSLCGKHGAFSSLPDTPPNLAQSALSANPFICHTSEKHASKSFACHTSKNIGLKVLYLPHLRKNPPAYPPFRIPLVSHLPSLVVSTLHESSPALQL